MPITEDQLQRAWDALRELHPDLPAAMVVANPRPPACGKMRATLIVVPDTALERPEDALERLLHQAAHRLDPKPATGSSGRYHAESYRDTARTLGLAVERGEPHQGWSETALARATWDANTMSAYRRVLRILGEEQS
mgnify:CR=1 FL=1